MISFKIITEDNTESLAESLALGLRGDSQEILREIIYSYPSDEENSIEYAIALDNGCALIRVFDMGRYFFLYPYEICDNASISNALRSIAEYAMREEIPLVFSDVEPDAFASFSDFRHISLDAEDSDCSSYRVSIATECALLDKIPEVDAGRVKLNAITEEDIADFARLSKDKNVNKYWGYDYSEDIKNPPERYFYEIAERDFLSGLSLSLAIRENEKFVGEAIVYAFDGMGSAEFAIRLLPEAMGRGLGRESVKAVFLLAEKIGLIVLRAKVLSENTPSHAMLSGLMEKELADNDSAYYVRRI